MTDDIETFTSFFSIPKAEVALALDSVAKTRDDILRELRKKIDGDHETPRQAAHRAHEQLLLARAIRSDPALPEEEALFQAAYPAWGIADLAASISHDKGQLAELSRRMREIELREGLKDGEYFPIDEGPDDHRVLQAESEALFDSIQATVFGTVLRRYGFHDIARLFDEDRATFEAMREVGRRLIFGRKRAAGDDTPIERLIRERYGEVAVAELKRRLAAYGLD